MRRVSDDELAKAAELFERMMQSPDPIQAKRSSIDSETNAEMTAAVLMAIVDGYVTGIQPA